MTGLLGPYARSSVPGGGGAEQTAATAAGGVHTQAACPAGATDGGDEPTVDSTRRQRGEGRA